MKRYCDCGRKYWCGLFKLVEVDADYNCLNCGHYTLDKPYEADRVSHVASDWWESNHGLNEYSCEDYGSVPDGILRDLGVNRYPIRKVGY